MCVCGWVCVRCVRASSVLMPFSAVEILMAVPAVRTEEHSQPVHRPFLSARRCHHRDKSKTQKRDQTKNNQPRHSRVGSTLLNRLSFSSSS